ncbi:MAG: hypothetical protein SFW09_13595 [Hyphomicrobiaceae bacterium]|nr:hypothetical protein [Hyphomicrobiaceae bacterium]
MSKRAIVIGAIGALLVTGAVVAVSAQGHRGGHGGGHMMGMHGDQDGRGMHGRFGRALTKDEFDARMRERFGRLDRNSDGTVDTAEIEGMINERMSARHARHHDMAGMGDRKLRRFDGNRDGKVAKDEMRAEVARRFAELDLNSDGKIDDADLPPMMRGRNAIAEGGAGMGGKHGRRMMGGMGWLRQADANRDGTVTREEVDAMADRDFARLDRNKDGVIDQADRDAIRKEMVEYAAKRFAHMNGAGPDGRVTREQFQSKAAERFARMDANGDGTISRDERPGRGWHGHHGHGRGHGGKGGGMMDDQGHGGMMGRGMGGPMGSGSDMPGTPPAKQ